MGRWRSSAFAGVVCVRAATGPVFSGPKSGYTFASAVTASACLALGANIKQQREALHCTWALPTPAPLVSMIIQASATTRDGRTHGRPDGILILVEKCRRLRHMLFLGRLLFRWEPRRRQSERASWKTASNLSSVAGQLPHEGSQGKTQSSFQDSRKYGCV